ncbi:MAG: hypothetical protein V1882_11430 [Candidatus Omnitrophota bacterium]
MTTVLSSTLVEYQFVLFANGVTYPNKLDLATSLISSLGGKLDGEPLILPIPKEAPPEIPRVILSSKLQDYRLQISSNRIDYFFKPAPPLALQEFFELNLSSDLLKIRDVFEQYQNRFFRVAGVINVTIELSKPGADYLLERYVLEKKEFGDPHDMELHCLNKLSTENYKFNQWLRIRSSRDSKKSELNNYLAVQIDINTLAEESYSIDNAFLGCFYENTSKQMRHLLNSHNLFLGLK